MNMKYKELNFLISNVFGSKNLFAFGDLDGSGLNAKFQHPLGVAYDDKEHVLYVADTYNHKIKLIDLTTNKVNTCKFKDPKGNVAVFIEPAGLCLSPCCSRLYICNTNNHSIDVVNLSTSILEPLNLYFDDVLGKNQLSTLTTSKILVHTSGAKISLEFILMTKLSVKFTDAPQKWHLDTLNVRWQTSSATSGNILVKQNESDGSNNVGLVNVDLLVPKSDNGNAIDKESIIIVFKMSLCADNKGICFPKNFKISVPIEYSVDGTTEINKKTNVTIDEQNIELS